ncbi:MAG: ATP-binding cassette domain-containing protein [Bacteroidetes bacterium]|nr:ATP-binding cassette domain-containing protein [Bacteroidota bacterium]MDA0902757.1 ATP-binding cassette domain-containing protein [Bacteroidota bacterium]MDA1242894.1 ATP-binding cassette domain-containing protein [Bacteroidota bacterium]
MTTSILEALIQLFALFAAGRGEEGVALGRDHAARYMRNQLPKPIVDQSLVRFDSLVDLFQNMPNQGPDMVAKRLSKLSVKLLRTCSLINKGLEWHEKHVVVVRLMEFLHHTPEHHTGHMFLRTVCESFSMTEPHKDALMTLVVHGVEANNPALFTLDDRVLGKRFGGKMVGLHLEEQNLFLVRTAHTGTLRINHQELKGEMVAMLAPGGTMRDSLGGVLFHSELVSSLEQASNHRKPLVLRAEDVSHYFQFPQEQALHQFNLEAEGGQLVGIMGGSGSGKSTLLGVLNGTTKPTFGTITINGVSIHDHPKLVAGWIGHVPQEDVLIAELTVQENLLFNAQLSLGHWTAQQQQDRVDEVLHQLGLWEARHLQVGSVMDKVISGGQRKRVNIGMELLRKPPVLFLDEPTSGLSSSDSEHILDILKELTYAGQLVFAVLHQPSSDLFKMLDRLFMLDKGGHPVYWGNPLDAVRHFNAIASRVHADECECSTCGNVNPEQIFEVIEAKTVDEYGRKTEDRRTTPKEWNDFYTVMLGNTLPPARRGIQPLNPENRVPKGPKQWKTYLSRDVLAKLRNKQYLLVNGLEAPVLACIMALFMRFQPEGAEYTFRNSENIPAFLFISVIVALFLGLSASAEEIFRDKSLLKRERFLQLKWHHYLHSKITVVAGVSALHALTFVAVSHLILDIPAFFWTHAVVLFVVSLFGNMLGLCISATFNSVKVIYITIPILVIPQIIFGGAIVRFERFNATLTDPDAVPWFGNIMASRWGFEALAVDLARDNPYDAQFIDWEDRIYRAAWRRDFWTQAAKHDADSVRVMVELKRSGEELSRWEGKPFAWPWQRAGEIQWSEVKARYNTHYAQAFEARAQLRREYQGDLIALKNASHNDELWEWMLQDDRTERAPLLHGVYVQKAGPIHRFDPENSALDATMYSPYKRLGGVFLTTLQFNVLALLCMSLMLWGMLLVWPRIQNKAF